MTGPTVKRACGIDQRGIGGMGLSVGHSSTATSPVCASAHFRIVTFRRLHVSVKRVHRYSQQQAAPRIVYLSDSMGGFC